MRISGTVIVLTLCLIGSLGSPTEAEPKGEADKLGFEWNGREEGGPDFALIRRGTSNVFDYYLIENTDRGKQVNGRVSVDLFGSKLNRIKMTRTVGGQEKFVYDGLFSADRRFISGRCYDLKEQRSESRNTFFWWATVELSRKPGRSASTLNINLATVKELETFAFLDPVSARNIVDHKLRFGSYEDIRDLLRKGIVSEQSYERMRTRISVK